MFYKVKIKDHIRVPPDLFKEDASEAIKRMVKKKYEGQITKELGFVIKGLDIEEIGEGVVIPEDGAAHYKTTFNLLTFKPENQEVVLARIKDIADFGAFVEFGPVEGMIHLSQTMDDFVNFQKEKVLVGKKSKKILKVGDKCKARIIAISFKDPNSPKIGLTMRQEGLGKIE